MTLCLFSDICNGRFRVSVNPMWKFNANAFPPKRLIFLFFYYNTRRVFNYYVFKSANNGTFYGFAVTIFVFNNHF